MKNCTNKNCKQTNPQLFSNFNKSKINKNGLKSRCKVCESVYRKENKEKRRLYNIEWRKRNPDWYKNYSKKWGEKNREKLKTKDAKWRKENPHKKTAKQMRRQAKKLKATPLWLTKAHLKEIEYFYELAKELRWLSDEPLEVDHIVPLQGKNVSGLHVPWNLQILPSSINISKGNKFK